MVYEYLYCNGDVLIPAVGLPNNLDAETSPPQRASRFSHTPEQTRPEDPRVSDTSRFLRSVRSAEAEREKAGAAIGGGGKIPETIKPVILALAQHKEILKPASAYMPENGTCAPRGGVRTGVFRG